MPFATPISLPGPRLFLCALFGGRSRGLRRLVGHDRRRNGRQRLRRNGRHRDGRGRDRRRERTQWHRGRLSDGRVRGRWDGRTERDRRRVRHRRLRFGRGERTWWDRRDRWNDNDRDRRRSGRSGRPRRRPTRLGGQRRHGRSWRPAGRGGRRGGRALVRPRRPHRRPAPAVLVVGDRLRRALLGHVAGDSDQQQRRLHLQAGRRRDRWRRRSPSPPASRPQPLRPGSAPATHTVELYRQTEGPQGDSQLMGLTVGGGALVAPPRGARAAHRGRRRLDQLWLRHARHAGGQRLLPDGERTGTPTSAVAARALGADVSTIADVRPGRLPQLRRRHDQHAADGLHARADQRRHARLGLPHAAAGGHRQPRHQRHQQRQGRSRARRSRPRTPACSPACARRIPAR